MSLFWGHTGFTCIYPNRPSCSSGVIYPHRFLFFQEVTTVCQDVQPVLLWMAVCPVSLASSSTWCWRGSGRGACVLPPVLGVTMACALHTSVFASVSICKRPVGWFHVYAAFAQLEHSTFFFNFSYCIGYMFLFSNKFSYILFIVHDIGWVQILFLKIKWQSLDKGTTFWSLTNTCFPLQSAGSTLLSRKTKDAKSSSNFLITLFSFLYPCPPSLIFFLVSLFSFAWY